MKTNIYDKNFKNEIKGYTISGLKEQISECVDMISEYKDEIVENNCTDSIMIKLVNEKNSKNSRKIRKIDDFFE